MGGGDSVDPRDPKYLAFGSNLHPARLGARTPSARALGAAPLPGWQLAFHKRSHDGSGKCSLVETRHPEDLAYGVVYALDPADRPALDRAEGLGAGYELRTLELEAFGEVFFYVAQASHVDDTLVPYDWYHRFVLEGARHHRLPQAYLRWLEAVPTITDPDPERVALNARILARLAT